MTRVVNKRRSSYDIYIGRPSLFGNPYSIGRDGTRAEVIDKFREYFERRLLTQPKFKAEVLKLRDKTLGCFCKPLGCHGDVIAEYLDR